MRKVERLSRKEIEKQLEDVDKGYHVKFHVKDEEYGNTVVIVKEIRMYGENKYYYYELSFQVAPYGWSYEDQLEELVEYLLESQAIEDQTKW